MSAEEFLMRVSHIERSVQSHRVRKSCSGVTQTMELQQCPSYACTLNSHMNVYCPILCLDIAFWELLGTFGNHLSDNNTIIFKVSKFRGRSGNNREEKATGVIQNRGLWKNIFLVPSLALSLSPHVPRQGLIFQDPPIGKGTREGHLNPSPQYRCPLTPFVSAVCTSLFRSRIVLGIKCDP